MSDQVKETPKEAAAPAQPNGQDVLFYKLYVPAFIQKAAEAGIPINSEQDLQHLLEVAAMLRIKQAQTPPQETGLYKAAATSLQAIIKQASAPQEPQIPLEAIKQDSDIKAALASLGL